MPETRVRQVLRLDSGWLFHAGDLPSPVPHTHIAAYMNHKAGWARGAARPNYDDSDWRELSLPHDWSIEGKASPANHPNQGFLPRGVGWYRRYFRLEESDRGGYLAIQFDGVATHCTVYVNGHLLHRQFNGYTPFTVDISEVANFGEQLNVVAVRVDANYMEGWWYEGAGIYRHVWLIKTGAVHVDTLGTFVCPQKIAQTEWDTRIETTLVNPRPDIARCRLRSQIIDQSGVLVGQARSELTIEPRSSLTVIQNAPVKSPRLWSLQARHLYHLRTEVTVGSRVEDDQVTRFGYRTIRFDPERGFFLNDQPVKLLGTCNHQDHAGVGVAVPDAVHRFRVARLLEMGSNAYRAAHHPPAPELLDACDELGMLVMDENRTFGSSPEVLEQLRTMVRRDRNHPCVILWSICNEEAIQTTEVSARIARAMVAEVKKLDSSRPVTAAVSGGILSEGCIGDELDLMSINYQLGLHDAYRGRHPGRALIASETHCVLSTRGEFVTDESRGVFACDDSAVHPWGATARDTWRFIRQRPFIAGLFVWTGFDYRGEPAPPRWPIGISQVGMLDLCGFPKDSFHLHRAWWTSEPFVHLFPHWNHRVGRTVQVRAYTNCESVELFLNGQSRGRARVNDIATACWDVPFEPGELRAIGYRGQDAVVTTVVQTAGAAVALRLSPMTTPAAPECARDGCCLIAIDAIDAQNRHVPDADHVVELELTGPGQILGVGNGDPARVDGDKSNTIALFHGLAQVIIRGSQPGQVLLIARASGSATLRPARLELELCPIEAKGVAAVQKRHFITDWRRSPVAPMRPDPDRRLSEADMNSWERVTIAPGAASAPVPGTGYVIYRATFTLPRRMQPAGAWLEISGLPEDSGVRLNGTELAGERAGLMTRFPVPAGDQKHTLSVVLRSASGEPGFTAVELVAGGGG